MRIFSDPLIAVREIERDVYEMGVDVHPQTMQDKVVADDPDYMTKEVQGYGFKIVEWKWSYAIEKDVVRYLLGTIEVDDALAYIQSEFSDRTSGVSYNPGHSYIHRLDIWEQFLHNGKFAYTYSERFAPQLDRIMHELHEHPDTRQAILNIHSNICPHDWSTGNKVNDVSASADLQNMGGHGRIPCSMYYQFLRRHGKLDMIYTMRSCDLLTHFPIDLMLALRMQNHIAGQLKVDPGMFTYFAGSLHSYMKDIKKRQVF